MLNVGSMECSHLVNGPNLLYLMLLGVVINLISSIWVARVIESLFSWDKSVIWRSWNHCWILVLKQQDLKNRFLNKIMP